MGRYISNINTNSYQDNELLRLKQGFAKNRKEFLTAGTHTWTIDHDVIARVRVWGGGGGGGGGSNYSSGSVKLNYPGAGGGAGGTAEAILRLNAGTYNITVGEAGTGGAADSNNTGAGGKGGVGGSSSFHTYITCSGGRGGGGGVANGAVNFGGVGGTASFNWSGFDGLLYVDSRFGGAGGSRKLGTYEGANNTLFLISLGSEGGAGESGGQAGYAQSVLGGATKYYSGGGGGGYNPPFIYGTDMDARENSGRGVGTGGAGGRSIPLSGSSGNAGAVVIEWN